MNPYVTWGYYRKRTGLIYIGGFIGGGGGAVGEIGPAGPNMTPKFVRSGHINTSYTWR